MSVGLTKVSVMEECASVCICGKCGHGDYRKKGYAAACSDFAKQIAEENHCCKMILFTGSKEESALNFYRNTGCSSSDKTAFIQWIDMWNMEKNYKFMFWM